MYNYKSATQVVVGTDGVTLQGSTFMHKAVMFHRGATGCTFTAFPLGGNLFTNGITFGLAGNAVQSVPFVIPFRIGRLVPTVGTVITLLN